MPRAKRTTTNARSGKGRTASAKRTQAKTVTRAAKKVAVPTATKKATYDLFTKTPRSSTAQATKTPRTTTTLNRTQKPMTAKQMAEIPRAKTSSGAIRKATLNKAIKKKKV